MHILIVLGREHLRRGRDMRGSVQNASTNYYWTRECAEYWAYKRVAFYHVGVLADKMLASSRHVGVVYTRSDESHQTL